MSLLAPSRLSLAAPITLAAIVTACAPATQQAPAQSGTIVVAAVPPPPPEVEEKPVEPPKAPPPPAKKSDAESARDAAEFGIIGLLANNSDPSPWGGGPQGGDASALGDLQLSGIGEGGGGRGEGIGLGSLGTNGSGSGTGQGFGSGNGRLGGSRAKPPQVRMGATQVTGRLPPEVIQRIVRQNFGRFRLCYENGLRNNPTLAGKVTVKFVIGKDGSVTQASKSDATMPDAAVVSCIVGTFQALSFPAPEDGKNVVVVYPIQLSPGEPDKPAAPPAPPAKKQ